MTEKIQSWTKLIIKDIMPYLFKIRNDKFQLKKEEI